MQSTDINDSLLQVLYLEQAQLYVHVACITAAVFDNLHTLPLEVRYIWSSRVTLATVLYYVTRYGIYTEDVVKLYGLFASPRGCNYTFALAAYIFDISTWAGEALLGLRVLALSGNDGRLRYSLPVIFIALLATSLVRLATFFVSMKFEPSPAPKIITCFVTHTNKDIITTIACVVVWDILMFILLLRSAWCACGTRPQQLQIGINPKLDKSGGTSQFIRTLHRDGLIYYLYTLILHSGNLVSFLVSPPVISSIFTSPTRFLQAAFVCRILLYTRRQEERTNAGMIGSIFEEPSPSTYS